MGQGDVISCASVYSPCVDGITMLMINNYKYNWRTNQCINIILLMFILFTAGCGRESEKLPSHRLQFPDFKISYMTPDDWSIKKIPGNEYSVVYTDLDYGIFPNIQVGIINEASYSIDSFIQKQKKIYKNYSVVNVSGFLTDRGQAGEKIEVRRVNNKNIPLSHFYYYLKINRTVYLITATCPEVTVQNYKHIFDKTLQTIEAG